MDVLSSDTQVQTTSAGSQTGSTSLPVSLSSSNPNIVSSVPQSSNIANTVATTNIAPRSTSTSNAATIILQVVPVSTPAHGRKHHHHTHHRTRYLGASSAFARANCSKALPFTLSNGELTGLNGDYFSADPSTTWEPFRTYPTKDSIITTFGLFPNGTLYWTYPSFTDNYTLFCQTMSGEIYALFAGPLDPPDRTYPNYLLDCNLLFLASECPITSTTTVTASHICTTFPSEYHWSTSVIGAFCAHSTIIWNAACTPFPTGL
ncbi:hypothetical protein F5882DRAFT_398336 [Hyaloscypha sp. PMI_1271]|nr:hypothetical protein F5882DRAFT_398336 [Hyaloscypha sp. PMI_1271]